MGIRETRKKLQRTVTYLVSEHDNLPVVLHELMLLKQTVDGYVNMLTIKCNVLDQADATETKQEPVDAEAVEPTVAEAAKQGFDTLYEDAG